MGTGVVELVAAALLIIGFWQNDYAAAGALLLGITGIGGVLTHVRVRMALRKHYRLLSLAFVLLCYSSS